MGLETNKKMDFLSNMPCYNPNSFTKFNPDARENSATKKKFSVYVSTANHEPEQVIEKDRSNILLRYLYKKKSPVQVDPKRRNDDDESGSEEPRTKNPRLSVPTAATGTAGGTTSSSSQTSSSSAAGFSSQE